MTGSEYAHYKRAMEWYSVDPVLRQAAARNPSEAFSRFGFGEKSELVMQGIRCILFKNSQAETFPANPYVEEYRRRNRFISERVVQRYQRDQYAADGIWRYADTVRNRCRMENRLIRRQPNI